MLLLDNNVLASKCYNQIIDEIRDCGFGVGATYTPPNEYEIMINNLKDSYNDRAYIRKAISIYKEIMEKLKDDAEKQNYILNWKKLIAFITILLLKKIFWVWMNMCVRCTINP